MNLENVSKQEIFDIVSTHLLKQNKKSGKANEGLDAYFVCLYRGPANTTCAVGCLISDKEYQPNMEYKAVHAVEVRDVLFPSMIGKSSAQVERFSDQYDKLKLLNKLQGIHDDTPVDQWLKTLNRVAYDFDLNFKQGE
jgi:hypothetical protein